MGAGGNFNQSQQLGNGEYNSMPGLGGLDINSGQNMANGQQSQQYNK